MNKAKKRVSKISIARKMLSKLPDSSYAGDLAGNSKIKSLGFGRYEIWGGSVKIFTGDFDSMLDFIQDGE